MSAGIANVIIDQGADWIISFVYEDAAGDVITLTGYTANLQLRTSYSAASASLSLSVGSGITITANTGTIAVRATATQTGALVAGDYVYDLELTSPAGIVTRLVEGRATVTPQVTR